VVGSWDMYIWRGAVTIRIWELRVLTCPGVPPLVQSPAPLSSVLIVEAQPLNSSEFRSFKVHTAARELEPANLSVPRNGRRIQRCRRKTEGGCEPWPGQPGRSDPKQ